MRKLNGFWLYGLSGSGKTFISKLISKKIKKTFIVDGDIVRKNISTDLKYTKKDRLLQNKRVLGLAKIIIMNKYIPVISSVYLSTDISREAEKIGIKIINIKNKDFLKYNQKLKNKKNVVGKSIAQPKIKSDIFINEFNNQIKIIKFIQKLKKFLK